MLVVPAFYLDAQVFRPLVEELRSRGFNAALPPIRWTDWVPTLGGCNPSCCNSKRHHSGVSHSLRYLPVQMFLLHLLTPPSLHFDVSHAGCVAYIMSVVCMA